MDNSDKIMELRNVCNLPNTAILKDIQVSFSKAQARYLEMQNQTISKRSQMEAKEKRRNKEFHRLNLAYHSFIDKRFEKQHMIAFLRLPHTASEGDIHVRYTQLQRKFSQMQNVAEAEEREQYEREQLPQIEAHLHIVEAHLHIVEASYLKCKEPNKAKTKCLKEPLRDEKKPLTDAQKNGKDRRKKRKCLENLIEKLHNALPDIAFLRDIETVYEVLHLFFGSKALFTTCSDIEQLNELCTIVEEFILWAVTLDSCVEPMKEPIKGLSLKIKELQDLAKKITSINLQPVPHVHLPPSHVSS